MKRLGFLVIIVFAFLLYQCERNASEPSLPMQILLEYANTNRTPEGMDIAVRDLERGYQQIPSPNAFDRFYYYEFLSWYNLERNQLTRALAYADSMKTATSGLNGGQQELAHAYNMRGAILSRMHNYSEALKELYAADVITSKYLDSCTSAEIFANLGAVLYEQGDYRQSLSYYKKSNAAAQTCGTEENINAFMLLQGSYLAKGTCYESLNMPDSARYCYYEALNLLNRRMQAYQDDSIFVLLAEAAVRDKLGNVDMDAGNWDKAESNFLLSISIRKKAGRENEEALQTRLKLAKMYLLQGQSTKTSAELNSIGEQLTLTPFPEIEMELLQLKSNYFETLNRSDLAYLAFKGHVRMRDSLSLMEGRQRTVEVEEPLVLAMQKDQLGTIPTQDEGESIYLKGSLVLLFVLLVIIYLIRRNLNESREHVRNLNQLNEEIRDQNEHLNTAMKALEDSFEENERVMRIVSHDLRNPVGSIVSLSLLLKANEHLDESAKEYSNMIHSLSRDVLGFMEEVLNLKTSLDVVDKSREDLHELLTYCISFMEFKAQEKGQSISLSGKPVWLMISREKIWRVFINILSNAIKFSPENTRIDVSLEANQERALIEFRDYGIGIPEEMQDKVFDMLTVAQRIGTSGEKPHGLGMAISKQIMEAHGGKIWLESKEGKGTTFYLEFPMGGVYAESNEPRETKQKEKESSGSRFSAKLV